MHQKTFNFSLLSTIKGQCSCTLFPLLGLRTLDLRFKGCRCSFLVIIYTLCFIFVHSMSIFFPEYIFVLSCFLACFIAFLGYLLAFYHVFCFDDTGLAFLDQDMPKYCVCAQILVLRCFLPCLCPDLHVCMLFFSHVYAQIYLFTCSLPCLCLDLYLCVLRAMFMCLDLHVGYSAMCF